MPLNILKFDGSIFSFQAVDQKEKFHKLSLLCLSASVSLQINIY